MHSLRVPHQDRRRAAAWVAAGVGALIVSVLAGGLAAPPGTLSWGGAGFVSFVLCIRKAILLWRLDEIVFDHRRPRGADDRPSAIPTAAETRSERSRRHLVAVPKLVIIALLAASSVRGQQTIFNVPTADILDRGKLYLETDWLWRPTDPSFAAGSPIRGVYGLGGNIEAGINFSGIATPGPSTPVLIPNLKWRPMTAGGLSITTGVLGQFFLRGSRDGTSSVLGYAHAALKLPIGIRLTAGGWWASSGFAGPGVENGGLFGLEQPINGNVTVAADWYTGHNGIGFASPGLILTAGRWVLYAAYSIKNGDSRGNGLLLELGFNVP